MIVYTSHPRREEEADEMIRLGMGVLIAPYTNWGKHPQRIVDAGLPVAVDNGAYGCYTSGYGWDEFAFLKLLNFVRKKGIKPEWVVCPDIVGGGLNSLAFSVRWADRLPGWPLYLAVQDGMSFDCVGAVLSDHTEFTGLFVGGSTKWKWQSADGWIHIAHKRGIACHIGRASNTIALREAWGLGADSCDSTNFQRHSNWIEVATYRNPIQPSLISPQTKKIKMDDVYPNMGPEQP